MNVDGMAVSSSMMHDGSVGRWREICVVDLGIISWQKRPTACCSLRVEGPRSMESDVVPASSVASPEKRVRSVSPPLSKGVLPRSPPPFLFSLILMVTGAICGCIL